MNSAALMTAVSSEPEKSASIGGRLVSVSGDELPLKFASLDAEARGGIARVTLNQRFFNPHDRALEVRYLLPLPTDGVVSGFSFTIGDIQVRGEVDRRERAKRHYEEAILSGRTAALIEQERTSLFNQRVGNIPPRTTVTAEIIVDQPLRWLDEGLWEWRFPTVVGARYLGRRGRVADAARLVVDAVEEDLPLRASLDLGIGDEIDAGDIESPSHALEARQMAGGDVEVRFTDDGVPLDRDVVVRWRGRRADVGVSLAVARPAAQRLQGRAFGLLTITPPERTEESASTRRDLVFLIDQSGSMSGRPLEQAVRIAAAMIDTLAEQDTLEIITFGSRPVRWRERPQDATAEVKDSAIRWLRRLQASGATEMRRGIIEALRPLRPDSQRQVVLITDGYIGFEQEIVESVLHRLPPGSRLHTVAVGSAPNRSLTEPVARAGRGVEAVIGLEEDAERAAARLVARTAAPVVTDVEIGGAGVRAVAPAATPDLFEGAPVLVAVELDPAGGPIEVRGRRGGDDFSQQLEAPVIEVGDGNEAIAALFAREQVEDLEIRIAAGEGWEGINEAILQVGIDFQISTRLTSWIAATKERTVDPEAARIESVMPHEMPYGVSAEGMGLRPAAGPVSHTLAGFIPMQTQAGIMPPMAQPAPPPARRAGPPAPAGAPPTPSAPPAPGAPPAPQRPAQPAAPSGPPAPQAPGAPPEPPMSESGELEADFELDDGDTGKSSFAVDELIEAELGRADAEEPRAELSLSAPALDDEVTDLPSEPDALFADDDEAERAVPERVVSRRARASAGAVAQPQNAAVMPQEAAAEPKKDFGGAPAPLEPSGALAEEQPERAPIAMTRKRRAGLWVALVIALLLTALVALVALRACSDGSADEVGGSTPAGETAPGGEK